VPAGGGSAGSGLALLHEYGMRILTKLFGVEDIG